MTPTLVVVALALQQPVAPPVPAPVIRAAEVMLARGDTIAAAYPWLWHRGASFIIRTDRMQTVLAGPPPRSEWFVPATDSTGRPALPGRLWVAPTHPHPWDTLSFAPVESLLNALPSTSYSERQEPNTFPVPTTVEGVISALLTSWLYDTEEGPLNAGASQMVRPSGVRAICPAGEASCAVVRALERQRLLAALNAEGSRRPARIREFLALQYLHEANGDLPPRYGGPSATFDAVRVRVIANATNIALARDSAVYDSALVHAPEDSATATAGLMLRLLDRLGVDWRPEVRTGRSAAELLQEAVGFDPRQGVLDAEWQLREHDLGGRVRPPDLSTVEAPYRLSRAIEPQGERTRYYAAALMKLARDSVPIGFEIPVAWLHDTTHFQLRPGRAGGFAVGDSGSAIYPEVERVVIRANEFTVDVSNVPVAVMSRHLLGPESAQITIFLPDSFLVSVFPRMNSANPRMPVTLDAPRRRLVLGVWTDLFWGAGVMVVRETPDWARRSTPPSPR